MEDNLAAHQVASCLVPAEEDILVVEAFLDVVMKVACQALGVPYPLNSEACPSSLEASYLVVVGLHSAVGAFQGVEAVRALSGREAPLNWVASCLAVGDLPLSLVVPCLAVGVLP